MTQPVSDERNLILVRLAIHTRFEFIQQAATDKKPFFLFVATYAPHQPATPAPRYENAAAGVGVQRVIGFAELLLHERKIFSNAFHLAAAALIALGLIVDIAIDKAARLAFEGIDRVRLNGVFKLQQAAVNFGILFLLSADLL